MWERKLENLITRSDTDRKEKFRFICIRMNKKMRILVNWFLLWTKYEKYMSLGEFEIKIKQCVQVMWDKYRSTDCKRQGEKQGWGTVSYSQCPAQDTRKVPHCPVREQEHSEHARESTCQQKTPNTTRASVRPEKFSRHPGEWRDHSHLSGHKQQKWKKAQSSVGR